jgi:glycosyltransferase involved in cell wall biosynthesis
VGRVSREKGLDILPSLSNGLRQAGIDHRLIVAGDGPMRTELQAACPHAIFTGSISHDEVGEVMASSDLFVFPSRTDTAGNVVLEAQASGLPVLVTDAGGPREQMVDGLTGFVCHDERAFATRIAELAQDEPLRARVGREARAHATERSWPSALAPLYQAYREAGRQALRQSAPASVIVERASRT